MTKTTAQQMSYDEWPALFEPYGYADITTLAPAARFHAKPRILEWEIRLLLKGSGEPLDEWAQRSHLLEQARQAVRAIEDKGYVLDDAPNIEFGGSYIRRFGPCITASRSWTGEARLRFTVRES